MWSVLVCIVLVGHLDNKTTTTQLHRAAAPLQLLQPPLVLVALLLLDLALARASVAVLPLLVIIYNPGPR